MFCAIFPNIIDPCKSFLTGYFGADCNDLSLGPPPPTPSSSSRNDIDHGGKFMRSCLITILPYPKYILVFNTMSLLCI
jgi:hypothetical protein